MAQTAPRTVLVTGAAHRLGRAIALRLAGKGWQVAAHYRNSRKQALATVDECSALGVQSAAFEADLFNEDSTRALLPAVVDHFGRVDAVINNAALFVYDSASTFHYAQLQTHMHTNVAAPVVLAQALHGHLGERICAVDAQKTGATENTPVAAGVVINLLDQKLWNPNPDFFSYTLSKAALHAANTLLAQALAPLVRVVGVAPGLTLPSNAQDEVSFARMHKMALLQHSSTEQDISHAVLFALENPSITATTLLVDGGQHLIRFERDFSMMK